MSTAMERIKDAQNAAVAVGLDSGLRRDARVRKLLAATGHLILVIEGMSLVQSAEQDHIDEVKED